ncbi:Mpo1-like protein [Chitinimonas sp. PSY-7]|uniref:Mpo1-like protein n=1 Tax=Chitinimonas sp. PSY-7 TaxID=3459088 RepID=UPI00404023CE
MRYDSFTAFYPYYLSEHQNKVCRRLHFLGSGLVLLLLAVAIFSGQFGLLWLLPVVGYGFAWVGHFVFEKNRPATFRYPLYSFAGDWVMFWQMLTRKLPL